MRPAARPEEVRSSPLPWEAAPEPTLDRLRRTFEPLSSHSDSDSAAGSGAPDLSMLRPRFCAFCGRAHAGFCP